MLHIFQILKHIQLFNFIFYRPNGAADQPQRVGKPAAFPPGIGSIRGWFGAARPAPARFVSLPDGSMMRPHDTPTYPGKRSTVFFGLLESTAPGRVT